MPSDSGTVALCEMCDEDASMYKCPRCCIQTCSVACFRRHKTFRDCSAARTDCFVSRGKLPQTFVSDTAFLRKAANLLESARRSFDKIAVCNDQDSRFRDLKERCEFVGIALLRCPPVLERRKRNTSFYSLITDSIVWKISLKFVNAEKKPAIAEEDGIPEQAKLATILRRYIHSKRASATSSVASSRLQKYMQSGLSGIRCYVETVSESSKRGRKIKFCEVDIQEPIKDCLSGMTILEYPHFYIILKDLESSRQFRATYGKGGKVQSRTSDAYKSRRSKEAEAELETLDDEGLVPAVAAKNARIENANLVPLGKNGLFGSSTKRKSGKKPPKDHDMVQPWDPQLPLGIMALDPRYRTKIMPTIRIPSGQDQILRNRLLASAAASSGLMMNHLATTPRLRFSNSAMTLRQSVLAKPSSSPFATPSVCQQLGSQIANGGRIQPPPSLDILLKYWYEGHGSPSADSASTDGSPISVPPSNAFSARSASGPIVNGAPREMKRAWENPPSKLVNFTAPVFQSAEAELLSGQGGGKKRKTSFT